MIRFVDREEELKFLSEQFEREGASFVVIYGRRRTGKTELVLRFLEKHRGIYYLADRKTYRENLRNFQKIAAEFLGDNLFAIADFPTWVDAFKHLVERLKEKTVIVIDEFPYLLEKGVLEEFQKIWDTVLSKRNIMLILIGSSVSMMEENVLSYSSPLYGRRTGQIRLKPLRFRDIREFLPTYDMEELLKVYGVLDGVPQYLLLFSPDLNFKENMLRNYLQRGSPLYEDAEMLLREELREVRRYFSILEAIASGKRNFTEIKNSTGMESGTLARYLGILHGLGFVKEDLPMFQKERMKRYRLSDNYFNFWFRYIYPNRWMIEAGKGERLYKLIEETLDQYISQTFEDLVRDLLREKYDWDAVGQWWNRRGDEIDVVALKERTGKILFGEVKWRSQPVGWNVVERLMSRAELVEWRKGDRREMFLVVSKSGFTERCVERMKEEGVMYWTLRDVEALMFRKGHRERIPQPLNPSRQ